MKIANVTIQGVPMCFFVVEESVDFVEQIDEYDLDDPEWIAFAQAILGDEYTYIMGQIRNQLLAHRVRNGG